MLNRPLVEALRQLFQQDITVVNENVKGTYGWPNRKQMLTQPKARRYAFAKNWGEVYRLNCPRCGDQRKRLYISHLFGQTIKVEKETWHLGHVYICHNEHCNLMDWFSQLKISTELPSLSTKPEPIVSLLCPLKMLPAPCLPINSIEVPAAVTRYLNGRNYNPDYLYSRFLVQYAPKGATWVENGEEKELFEDRIVIPIIQRGIIVGWQARRAEDIPGDKYKYLNPVAMRKSQMLYNMDVALYEQDLVIVEGTTKVWRMGVMAIALFGKRASLSQLSIIDLLWGTFGQCVICLDPDAKEESLSLEAYFREHQTFPRGVAIAPVVKDPGDYSYDEITRLIAETRTHCK